jgi:NADH-quinone oxidoreductase subunit N
MTWTSLNAWVAMPEIFLLCASCAVLLIDLFVSDAKRHITYVLTLLVLAVTAFLVVNGYQPSPRLAFNGLFISDPIADFAKIGMILGVALVLIYGRDYSMVRGLFRGELFTLTLFALAGMMIMASSVNFLTLYMGLELLSLSLYALVALQRDSVQSTEAAMKYFILGALASGMLLYGMSMIYGATASLDIFVIAHKIASGEANRMLAAFGLVFLVTGIGFKLGAVPFHMWVPDVYEGAPTPVTQLIGSAPKLAAFVFVIRLLAQGMEGYAFDWRGMLVVLSVLSMGIGNLTAIAQTSMKRMMAYSTISHMGFLLLGILVASPIGYAASFFYAMVYVLTAAAGFGMVMLLSREGFEADKIDDFKGLAARSPWFACMMMFVMFSMAGIPVFVGFFAKLSVLQAVVNLGYVWLAVIAVMFSLVGAFYYLRIVKIMYFDEATDTAPIAAGFDTKLVLSVNCILLLVMGLMPDRLMSVLSQAVTSSLTVPM